MRNLVKLVILATAIILITTKVMTAKRMRRYKKALINDNFFFFKPKLSDSFPLILRLSTSFMWYVNLS